MSIRIMWRNLVDELASATLSASSAATPVSNLLHHHIGKKWRTAGLTNEVLAIDLGTTSETVRSVIVAGHNLTTSGTVELKHSDDNVTFTSLGTKSPDKSKYIAFFFSKLTSRYWQIIFNDAGNKDNFISVGKLFLGNYWSPSAQIVRGWTVEVVDETKIDKSIGGQKWKSERPSYLRVTFRLPHLSQSEAVDNFLNIVRRMGLKKDLFISLFPEGSETIKSVTNLYGRFIGSPGVFNPAIGVYDTSEIVFEESL